MVDIAALLASRQEKYPASAPLPVESVPQPRVPGYERNLVLPPVYSLDPAALIIPNLPEALELGRSIYDRAQRRRFTRPVDGSAGSGRAESSPLVSNSKSHRFSCPVHLDPSLFIPLSSTVHYVEFSKDVFVCRHPQTMPPQDRPGGTRASIYEFSDKSQANLDHVCCNSGHRIRSQFLLTYHDQNPTDGKQVKKHLDAFLKAYRRIYPGEGYLWVIEFQLRGVPHFHLFFTVPPDRRQQERLAKSWVRITKGSDKQLRFHLKPKNWIEWKMDSSRYLLKEYCVKVAQKDVPPQYQDVGRFWGCSRNMQPLGKVHTPEEVAQAAQPSVMPWTPEGVAHYVGKILRRWQEHQMNKDKSGQRRKSPTTGKVLHWKKASITRQRSTLPGEFKIKNGAAVLQKLMCYINKFPPDPYTIKQQTAQAVPF